MWFDQRTVERSANRRMACVYFTQGRPGHRGTAEGEAKPSSSLRVPHPPRAWACRKCLWNGCLQPTGAKTWGLGGSGFCRDSSTGGVWTGKPRALILSSSKWVGRASPTGTGPREGWWRKRCLCRLQSAVGVETLPVFSEGAWHAGWGQGPPRTDG